MPKYTNIVESDIFDITKENIAEKLKDHISGVLRLMTLLEYTNVKMITRIKEMAPHKALITTEIDETIKKIMEE